MTWYDLWLFLHISFAVLWIGGGAMMQFFALRVLASNSPERLAQFSQDVEWIASRFLTAFALGAFLTGVGLVVNAEFWDFGDDWIVIGLILFAVTFLAGAVFFGPEAGRVGKLVAAEGPTSPVVQARIRRLLVLTRIDLIVLFLIIFDMAVKPSFSDTGTIIGALIIAGALAFLLVMRGARSQTSVSAAD